MDDSNFAIGDIVKLKKKLPWKRPTSAKKASKWKGLVIDIRMSENSTHLYVEHLDTKERVWLNAKWFRVVHADPEEIAMLLLARLGEK